MVNGKIGSLSELDIRDIYRESALHGNDGDKKKVFGIVAILDVLGWCNRADEESIKEYVGLINRLRERMYDTYKRCVKDDTPPNFNITTLSDTIAILINGNYPYCELNVFNHISVFLEEALEHGFMFRGAISRGEYFTNSLNNVFVGKPFFEAAKYAEKTEWAGVIITDTLSSVLLENNSIQDLAQINIIQYDNIPFKEGTTPCKDKLVLIPQNRKRTSFPSQMVARLDYKKLYGEYMKGQIEKYHNTKAFIEYLEKTVWID